MAAGRGRSRRLSVLLDLEHARLRLRRFGFMVDRGRLVREAIAVLLAGLDARGQDSLVARRVRAAHENDGAQASPGARYRR